MSSNFSQFIGLLNVLKSKLCSFHIHLRRGGGEVRICSCSCTPDPPRRMYGGGGGARGMVLHPEVKVILPVIYIFFLCIDVHRCTHFLSSLYNLLNVLKSKLRSFSYLYVEEWAKCTYTPVLYCYQHQK